MAASKTSAAVTGRSTSGTTPAVSLSTVYRAALGVSIVQVGTATTAASFYVQVSHDGTNYYDWAGSKQAGIAAGTAADTYTWEIELPDGASNFQIVFAAQSGGTSSTLAATVGELTS
jgi:hypothetical protein